MRQRDFFVIGMVFLLTSSGSLVFAYTDEERYIYDHLYLHLPWEAAEYRTLTQENRDIGPTHIIGSIDEYALDFGLTSGVAVVAAADGIAYAYRDGDTKASAYGNHIKIDHGYFYTLYAHLLSINEDIDGYEVRKGDVIGLAGSTGGNWKAHLHFGLYYGNAWEDGYNYSVQSRIVIANEGFSPYQIIRSTEFERWQIYLSENFRSGHEGSIICENG